MEAELVCQAIGRYEAPFKVRQGVTQGGPLFAMHLKSDGRYRNARVAAIDVGCRVGGDRIRQLHADLPVLFLRG